MSIASRLANRMSFPVFMTLVVLLLLFEAITKGWFMFYVIPLLIVAVPLLLVVQIWNRRLQRQGKRRVLARAATLQLLSLIVFYVAMPGLYDTETLNMFGFWPIDQSNPIVSLCGIIAAVAAMVFVICSVQAIILLGRAKRHIPNKPVI